MKHVPEIVQHDKSLYEILTLIDAIRIGSRALLYSLMNKKILETADDEILCVKK
jgi:hypothetical protein